MIVKQREARLLDPHPDPESVLRCLATAVAAVPILVLARAKAVGFGWGELLSVHPAVPRALVASIFDLAVLTLLTAVTLVTVAVTSRARPAATPVILFGHVGMTVFLLGASLVNVFAMRIISRPLTYQWLYYSDYLQSDAALRAAEGLISVRGIGAALIALCTFFFLRWAIVRHFKRRLLHGVRTRKAVIAVTIGMLAYFTFATAHLTMRGNWADGALGNPVAVFVASFVAPVSPTLFSMETSVLADDVWTQAERDEDDVFSEDFVHRPSNVIVVVVESAGAVYYSMYGGPYDVDRYLRGRLDEALLFKNFYTTMPATNKAMVSLLCSSYPLISYRSLTRERPDQPLGCLPDQLKSYGYRTGIFNSSDLRFQRGGEFLKAREFDVVQDFRSRSCDRPLIEQSTEDWPHSDASDDGCTMRSMLEWIDEEPDAPFFAVVWTAMGHFPYVAPEVERDFGVEDPFLHRYLNALSYADELIESMLQGLEHRGLGRSTLVVITSDHGEAFGQHGYYAHATIHEETVRIPLVILQPGHIRGGVDETVGGLVDLAPTIVSLIGLPPHADWQGRSLFALNRPGRTYFFSPWADHMFGFRENQYKYIINASRGEYLVHDIVDDPGETINLTSELPGVEDYMRNRLAAWVQYQQSLWDRRFAEPVAAVSDDG